MVNFPSLANQGMISIDTETRDPDLKTKGPGTYRGAYIAGIAIGTEAGFRGYFPIAHEAGPNLPKNKVLKWLNSELSNNPAPKVGSKLIYDLDMLRAAGVTVAGPYYDIQVAEPLLDEHRFQYGLDALAKSYLKEEKIEDELIDFIVNKVGCKPKDAKNHIWKVPPKIVAPYAIGDIDLPLRIFAKQKAKLEKTKLWDLFIMESKLIPMLVAMRERGVRVDLDKTEQLLKQFRKEQKQVEKTIFQMSGIHIRPWVARDIEKIFLALNLEYPRTEKTDMPSFRANWLEHHEHPIAQQIRRLRWLDKMCGTFLENAILNSNIKGRIHCQFHQLKSESGGAMSGRFSSSTPNLQQIPVRKKLESNQIRGLFIPDEGCQWAKLDYSQIEYRIIVHDAFKLKLPGASHVVDQYINDPDTDFHQAVADMTGLHRDNAKTINFGMAYGEGVRKLCFDLGLPREEGEKLLNEYHRKAPFMRPLAKGLTGIASTLGVIETLMGRKARFNTWVIPNWEHPEKSKFFRRYVHKSQRAFTHKALNARAQGSAADILKRAMVDIWESGICNELGAPHLTVHDELDLSVPPNKIKLIKEIKNIMENVIKLAVPLKVDLEIGPTWGETK